MTVTHRKRKLATTSGVTTTTSNNNNNTNNNIGNNSSNNNGISNSTTKGSDLNGVRYNCDYCQKDITLVVRICCAECENFDLCLECFSQGREMGEHRNDHAYRVIDTLQYPLYTEDWSAEEEWLLLEAIQNLGMGNWEGISDYVGTKTKNECRDHYLKIYIESPNFPLPSPNNNNDQKIDSMKFSTKAKVLTKEGIICITGEPFAMPQQERPIKKIGSQPANHEISGFMPKRWEFDVEYENDAELTVKDLSFKIGEEPPAEIEAKATLLDIYNGRLERRLERKKFIRDRHLTEYKRHSAIDKLRSREEKDLLQQIKPFARIQSPSDFNDFYTGLLAESDLVNRLSQMQTYRKMGLRTLAEINEYERDKRARDLAKMHQPSTLLK